MPDLNRRKEKEMSLRRKSLQREGVNKHRGRAVDRAHFQLIKEKTTEGNSSQFRGGNGMCDASRAKTRIAKMQQKKSLWGGETREHSSKATSKGKKGGPYCNL